MEEEIIDDEEFSVVYEAYAPQNLPFQQSAYEKFSLENKNFAECKADFRVNKRDIALLVEALRVPPVVLLAVITPFYERAIVVLLD